MFWRFCSFFFLAYITTWLSFRVISIATGLVVNLIQYQRRHRPSYALVTFLQQVISSSLMALLVACWVNHTGTNGWIYGGLSFVFQIFFNARLLQNAQQVGTELIQNNQSEGGEAKAAWIGNALAPFFWVGVYLALRLWPAPTAMETFEPLFRLHLWLYDFPILGFLSIILGSLILGYVAYAIIAVPLALGGLIVVIHWIISKLTGSHRSGNPL